MSTTPLAQARDTRQRALWERTAAVAGRLNRAHAELVDIAAELIDDRHWGDGGFKTPEHYLVVRAGLAPGHASDIVQVARRRTELVEAAAALDAGQLSLDQVAVIARSVPPSYVTSVTSLARNATVPQLRRAVSRHGFPVTPPQQAAASAGPDDEAAAAADPRAQVQRAHDAARASASEERACARPDLSMSYDADGRFQLRYSAPATIGALVEQAVKEAKDALFTRRRDAADPGTNPGSAPPTNRGPVDPRAGLPTYADALEEMATRSLAAVTSTSRASRYRVYLHLSTDGAWINGGHAIPLRLLTRFITDGKVQPVWETDGRPISVGRSMRILPDRTRRLIIDRDRGCRFPGCPTTSFVEIHHLNPWADGGPTDEHNQISLCTVHHDGIDRGDHTITGDPTRPDGLHVTNRYGLPIAPPQPAETTPPPGGDPPVPDDTYHPPSGGPLRWTDLELPPDTGLLAPLPIRKPLTPQQKAELHARLTQEWDDEAAANRNPLIRRNW